MPTKHFFSHLSMIKLHKDLYQNTFIIIVLCHSMLNKYVLGEILNIFILGKHSYLNGHNFKIYKL